MTHPILHREELALEPGAAVEIDLRQGAALLLTGRDDGPLEAVLRGRAREGGGPTLEASSAEGGGYLRLAAASGASPRECSLELHLPRQARVRVRSTGGDLSAEGLVNGLEGTLGAGRLVLHRVAGEVDLKTGAGDVELTGCRITGSVATQSGKVAVRGSRPVPPESEGLRIRSGSGDIRVEGTGRGLKLSTCHGNIRVESAFSSLDAETAKGDVAAGCSGGSAHLATGHGRVSVGRVDPREGAVDLEVSATNGGIDVGRPGDLEMELDVRLAKTSGRWIRPKLQSDFELPETDRGRSETEGTPREYRHMKGTFGAGSHRIALRAVDGNVRVRRL